VNQVDGVGRRIALALIAGAALGLAGCATSEAPLPAQPNRYSETISSVLVSEDGKRLAAIGSGHHYIFDAPDVLVKALRSPVHPQLTATFAAFHLDQRGVLTGDWLLTLAPRTRPIARAACCDDAATPIRIAADGVQLIYWAPLAPVIVPILFLTRAKDH
jgi:hypothetical protein